jgi:hypothetical protein
MFLWLEPPDDWTVLHEAHQTVALSPGSTPERPVVLVAWGPLVPADGDDALLWRRLLEVDARGRRIEVGAPAPGRTQLGWPYLEVPARLFDGDAIAEERVAAVYRFDAWRGTALVRAAAHPAAPAHLEAARRALAHGVPDWRSDGEIVCVAHFYEEPS